MRTTPALLVAWVVLTTSPAFADLSSENAHSRARTEVLPKVNYECELSLSLDYDHPSLREYSKLQYGEADVGVECNEPLRYLWYACKTEAGKAAVKNSGLERVVCKGTPNKVGALTLANGTLTVDRAAEEDRPWERTRKRFEQLFHLTLKFPDKADKTPGNDKTWSELRYAPNPTRSTTDYCIVNGNKQEFSPYIVTQHERDDVKLECLKNGQKVADIELRSGAKTGFYTQFDDRGDTIFSYRDNRLDGETKTYRGGRVASIVMYKFGEIVWSKDFYPSGKIKEYSLKLTRGWARFRQSEDSKIHVLDCDPEVSGDVLLRELCGFEGEMTTRIYDGVGKLKRIETWNRGVLLKQRPGDGENAERSTVDFVDGKKHGTETILGKDGKLESTIQWDRGVKHGKEVQYAAGGTKVVKQIVWKAGEAREVTEYFLNGNPKSQEIYADSTHKQFRKFWDTGKLARQGDMVWCSSYGARSWCEDGLHRSYFEDGKPEAEATFKQGERHGASRSWWPNGKPATVEEFANGTRLKSKRWDQAGKLTVDEEYEADGSRKLRR